MQMTIDGIEDILISPSPKDANVSSKEATSREPAELEEESALLEIMNEDSYYDINDNVLCLQNWYSYIVEEIVSKRSQMEHPVTKDNDEEDSEPMVTYTAARHSEY